VRRLAARLFEHRLALIEADDITAEVLSEESRATGDVQRVSGRQCSESLGETLEFVRPARPFASGKEPAAEVPVDDV